MHAQDDAELFDLYDAEGRPLGRTKTRAAVHRDGDWHRSIHIWVVLLAGEPGPRAAHGAALVMQRRSPAKDTWPGAIDVAVTGHARAGETLAETLREAHEEIGLALAPHDVVTLGRRRRADSSRSNAADNELQDIYAHLAHVPLDALRPNAAEVTELWALPFVAMGELYRGERDAVDGERLTLESGRSCVMRARLAASDFIPARGDYYQRAHASLGELVAGRSAEPWALG